ncbi:hypothetical protein GCM10027168_11340 [Streptomyces capparidis]
MKGKRDSYGRIVWGVSLPGLDTLGWEPEWAISRVEGEGTRDRQRYGGVEGVIEWDSNGAPIKQELRAKRQVSPVPAAPRAGRGWASTAGHRPLRAGPPPQGRPAAVSAACPGSDGKAMLPTAASAASGGAGIRRADRVSRRFARTTLTHSPGGRAPARYAHPVSCTTRDNIQTSASSRAKAAAAGLGRGTADGPGCPRAWS